MLHYRWQWRLRASPEALWPYVADTNRFNRDTGIPAVTRGAVGANARRHLALTKLGVPIEWEEEPFEWVEPRRFSVVRRYRGGPLRRMDVAVGLEPLAAGGTLLTYDVRAQPRNALGRAAAQLEIGGIDRKRFERAMRAYDRAALAARPPVERSRVSQLAPGGGRRLQAARSALVRKGLDAGLVDRLADLVEHGDDLEVGRLRPYVIADAWHADRREVLEVFLHATRAGVLEFRWDLLCPLCRGTAETARSLDELDVGVHCNTCLIDFTVDFDRSVELAFRPSPAMREVEPVDFCVGGPRLTPHVVAQQLLAPGAVRTISPRLSGGGYRVRVLGGRAFARVDVAPGGADDASLRFEAAGWTPPGATVSKTPTLRVENASGDEELVVFERTAWLDDAVTAAEVTTFQLFRDLFASEALRPGEPISVGSLTVLFTDLRDSTRFYREIGDAPAFGSVMAHLDLLRAAVDARGGAVVKAMGDAIMAVFTRPAAALEAAFDAQRRVAEPADGRRPHWLKVGVHTGPAIAVTQNGRLDYFGSTVNLAARLVSLSTGEDVVVSKAVLADPEVADVELDAEPMDATLKGFEDERFELFRLRQEAALVAG